MPYNLSGVVDHSTLRKLEPRLYALSGLPFRVFFLECVLPMRFNLIRAFAAGATVLSAFAAHAEDMMGVTFATVVLIIRLAVPGEDLQDFYPGGGRDDNMIGFFNAHDCMVAARLVVSIHKGPIEASCYEWDPFEHELGEKFSETSRPDS